MSIYKIIQSVADIGSTITKQKILEDNKDNVILKKCFLYSENKRFNFYIKVKPLSRYTGTYDLSAVTFNVLDDLINRVVTGDAARNVVEAHMQTLTTEAQEIFARIINRDLRCNAGTSIANKVWKNLIPEYPMMLCSKFDTKSKKYLSKFENNVGFIGQKKSDGGRCLIKVDSDGNVTYHSRNGAELNLFGVFDDQFMQYTNMIFDGELLTVSGDGVASRKESNGNYTRAVRGTLTLEQAERFRIDLWDMLPLHEFNAGMGTEQYRYRLNYIQNINFDSTKVSVVESVFCNTIDECVVFYDKMRVQGEEGMIIKVANSVWEDARSKNCVKLKAEESFDALVIGVELGTGKYADMIGALVCTSSCGKLKFNVGTGFNDNDRSLNHDVYLGKIVEISYNEIISSRGRDTKSLFLPVFRSIRHELTVANSLEELK